MSVCALSRRSDHPKSSERDQNMSMMSRWRISDSLAVLLEPLTACLFILTCKQQQSDTRAAPQLLFSHLAFTQITDPRWRPVDALFSSSLRLKPRPRLPSNFPLCVRLSSVYPDHPEGGRHSSSVCSLSKLGLGFGFARKISTTGQTQTPPSDIFTAREGNRLNIWS